MNTRNLLITGGTGTLGRYLIQRVGAGTILAPPHQEMDITNPASIKDYFAEHTIDAVIHTAALARLAVCESDPVQACTSNIIGTAQLVNEILNVEAGRERPVRFIHVSTDGVYASRTGGYKESDATLPRHRYGWTKLGAECAVCLLPNHCIVRTRFFDPDHIRFDSSATDIFTSTLPVPELAEALIQLLDLDYVGVVNVGGNRISDYDAYLPYRPEIKPCLRRDFAAALPFEIAHDASLDCSLWHSLRPDSP